MRETFQLGDSAIEFQRTGENRTETVLFLHGLGADLAQFKAQHDFFDKKYQVISINLRGHGQSKVFGKPRSTMFKLSKMASDVTELLDRLGVKKVHFVGNSMGGNVGYEILKQRPVLFKTFTTFGTTGKLSTTWLKFNILKFQFKMLSVDMIGSLSKIAGRTIKSKAKIKEMMSKLDKNVLLSILPNIANFNYLNVIKNSTVPCLIIKGESDEEINNEIDSTIAAFEQRGNFQMVHMNNVGHFANLDDTNLFNKTLSDFIEKEQ